MAATVTGGNSNLKQVIQQYQLQKHVSGNLSGHTEMLSSSPPLSPTSLSKMTATTTSKRVRRMSERLIEMNRLIKEKLTQVTSTPRGFSSSHHNHTNNDTATESESSMLVAGEEEEEVVSFNSENNNNIAKEELGREGEENRKITSQLRLPIRSLSSSTLLKRANSSASNSFYAYWPVVTNNDDPTVVPTPRNINQQLEYLVNEGCLYQFKDFLSHAITQDRETIEPESDNRGDALIEGEKESCEMTPDHRYRFLMRHRFQQQCSLLHLLSKSDNIHAPDLITYLVEDCNFDVDERDQYDSTPLFYACAAGTSDIVFCLLGLGARVNVRDSVGHFPLMVALRNGHQQIIEALIYADADVNMTYTKGDTCVHMLAQKGDITMLKFLIEQDRGTFNSIVQLGAKNRHNENALFYSLNNPPFLNFLLDTMKKQFSVTEMNRCLTSTNSVGYNLFHKCAEVGNIDALFILTTHMSDSMVYDMINERDACLGNTPLHIAVLHDNADLVALLARSNDVDINAQNKSKDTPLHIALKDNMFPIARSLLEGGRALVMIANKDSETCAGIAASLSSSKRMKATVDGDSSIPDDILDLIQLSESIIDSSASSVVSMSPRSHLSRKLSTSNLNNRRSIAILKDRFTSSRKSLTADVRKLLRLGKSNQFN